MDLKPLTDAALLARLDALASQERENVADIVAHLAEVDRRELAVDRGYSTLFDYCREKLRYSEAAAFLRIRAARAANRFPRILDDLRSGAIHLDAVMRLYPHLNPENSDQVLDQAAGASKREVLALVAAFDVANAPVERDVIRHLPPTVPALPAPGPEREANEIIAPPPRVRLAFTADDEFLRMLEKLRGLRRHKFPGGRLEDLLKEAMADLLKRIDPDRRSRRSRANASARAGKPSRRVPAAVRAEVWTRDGGRCAYLAPDGRRCESKFQLEYDHIVPWALGGRSDDAGNIRLLCRSHNQRLARRRFGPRRY